MEALAQEAKRLDLQLLEEYRRIERCQNMSVAERVQRIFSNIAIGAFFGFFGFVGMAGILEGRIGLFVVSSVAFLASATFLRSFLPRTWR